MSFRKIGGFAAMTTVLALVSLPAAAQAPPQQRGYVVGIGGLGATNVSSPVFGASGGFNVTPDLQITVDAGRMQDVQANFTHDDLVTLDSLVTAATGVPFSTALKMPTNYYTGGVRYLFPVRGAIRPYASGSAGVAHMSPALSYSMYGIDVTGLMETALGDSLSATFGEQTRPMASFGGGVVVTVVRHLTFDVGYKYSAIFIKSDYLQLTGDSHKQLHTQRVVTGVGVTF